MLKLLSAFATPIGNLLTTGIAAGSASFITYATAHGMDISTASTIAISGAGLLAAVINWGGGLMGVQIHVVNTSDNGVKVVPANSPSPAVDSAQK